MQPEPSEATPKPLRRNRDFQLLWSGTALSSLGGEISFIAYPLLVLAMTGSPALTGVVAFAGVLPYPLFQLVGGGLVDRFNRRAVLIACDVGRLVTVLSVAVALWFDVLTFAQIVAAVFLENSLTVVFRLAENAVVTRVVPASQLPDAIAQNQARSYAASLAGQPLGGLLFGLNRVLPFAVDAASYLFSLVAVCFLRTPLALDPREERSRLLAEIGEGLRWFWRQRFIRTASFLVAGSDFVITGLFLVVIVAATEQGASPTEVGIALALGGAGGMLGALAAPVLRRRIRSERAVIVGAAWLGALLVPLLAVAPGPIALGVVLGAILSVWPLWNAVVSARMQLLIPDELRGRVMGASMLVVTTPAALAPLLAGILLETAGVVPTVLAAAGVMALDAAGALLSRSIRAGADEGGDRADRSPVARAPVGPDPSKFNQAGGTS